MEQNTVLSWSIILLSHSVKKKDSYMLTPENVLVRNPKKSNFAVFVCTTAKRETEQPNSLPFSSNAI